MHVSTSLGGTYLMNSTYPMNHSTHLDSHHGRTPRSRNTHLGFWYANAWCKCPWPPSCKRPSRKTCAKSRRGNYRHAQLWGHDNHQQNVGPCGATWGHACDMDITQHESKQKVHGHMTVRELILDPVDFGAPTHRRRRFMVAMHQGYARWRLPGMTWRRALLPFLRRTSLRAADCTTPPSAEASRAYQLLRSFTMLHCMCAHGQP